VSTLILGWHADILAQSVDEMSVGLCPNINFIHDTLWQARGGNPRRAPERRSIAVSSMWRMRRRADIQTGTSVLVCVLCLLKPRAPIGHGQPS
jgi:hypothetical protein